MVCTQRLRASFDEAKRGSRVLSLDLLGRYNDNDGERPGSWRDRLHDGSYKWQGGGFRKAVTRFEEGMCKWKVSEKLSNISDKHDQLVCHKYKWGTVWWIYSINVELARTITFV